MVSPEAVPGFDPGCVTNPTSETGSGVCAGPNLAKTRKGLVKLISHFLLPRSLKLVGQGKTNFSRQFPAEDWNPRPRLTKPGAEA